MSSGRRRYSPNIQVRNQGRAKEKSASEMKKVSLSVSKGRVSLVLFYHKRSLNQNLSYSRCGIMSEMRFRNLFFMQLVHARISRL